VLQTAVLAVWLRVVNVASVAGRWGARDLVPGVVSLGAGLAAAPRRPREGLSRAGSAIVDIVAGAIVGLGAMVVQVVGVFRPLTADELAAGRSVYADTIPWHRVRVFSGSYLAWLASWAAKRPTAVVTMRVVHVPRSFETDTTRGRAWLVHELMHVWQGQHTGPSAMVWALVGQARHGYDYGGEDGLRAHADRGLAAFNPEQQADIMRGYYRRLVDGGDVSAYLPYVEEVRAV
jgi:hypothetical protein